MYHQVKNRTVLIELLQIITHRLQDSNTKFVVRNLVIRIIFISKSISFSFKNGKKEKTDITTLCELG